MDAKNRKGTEMRKISLRKKQHLIIILKKNGGSSEIMSKL